MPTVSLSPVDGDPFNPTLTPVDGDPFQGPQAYLAPYTPSWTERIGSAAQDLMTGLGASKSYAQNFSEGAQNLAGLVPGLGNALSANQAYRDYQSGNYVGAGLNAAAAIPLPGASLAGDVERGVEGAAANLSKEGEIWFHGSGQSYNPARNEPLYMAEDPLEAAGFARGVHLGGSGNNPQIHAFMLDRAPIADIGKEVDDALEEGDDVDGLINGLANEHLSNPNGVRFLDFDHPSAKSDDYFNARVAIDPRNTMTYLGSIPVSKLPKLTPVDFDPFDYMAAPR